MSEIQKTTDYNLFKKMIHNRDIDTQNLNRIIHSIKARNLLEFRPILVNSSMEVVDGQHRLEAAKLLQLPIYYQIEKSIETEDVLLLNANQKRWSLGDYINFHISQGNTEYEKIRQFCLKNEITEQFFISIARGASQTKRNAARNGKLSYPPEEDIKKIETLLTNMKKVITYLQGIMIKKEAFIGAHKFKQALMAFLRNEEVDVDVLLNKLTIKLDCIHKCADTFGYFSMLKDIYNWKNKEPFLATLQPHT
jgi:ParB-like nuclease domain